MTYGGDYYGGTEYAGMRNRNTGPLVTVVSKAVNAVVLMTKNAASLLLSKVKGVVLRSRAEGSETQLTTKRSDSVTISSKNDNIIL